MATFIMLPDGDAIQEWDASGGGTSSYTDVDNDNGDTEYAFSNTTGERMVVDLVPSPVASGDVDTINSVTIKASVKKYSLGTAYVILRQSGTAADSSAIDNGPDTLALNIGSYTTVSGPAEPRSDGLNLWDYGDLAGLQLRVNQHRNLRFGHNRISYLYAEVDYTPAVVTADNATFFGANF